MNNTTKTETNKVTSLNPHLVCAGAAEAIDFYQRAFGAKEEMRLPAPNGKLVHACVSIDGFKVMLVDENLGCAINGPKTLGGTPVTIHLMVEDADAFFARAVDAGASVVMSLEDTFWGDRYGLIEDPFGHRWSIATHLRDLSPEELQRAMHEAMPDFGKE